MQATLTPTRRSGLGLGVRIIVAIGVWLLLYSQLEALANAVTFSLLGLERGSHLGDAVAFFLYDVPKITLLLAGIVIIVSVIGRLGLDGQVEEYVRQIKVGAGVERHLSFEERITEAIAYTRDLLKKVLPWVLGGIAIGALIHGYAPTDFVVEYAGRDNLLAVPLAVVVAIPLYSNAAGTIPIVQALMAKGVPLGTTLAFMMAVTAISVPELVILRRVIKPKLIAAYVGVVTLAIILIGYLFNAVM